MPTLESLPVVSGRDDQTVNSSKNRGNASSESGGRPFGEILDGQERSAANATARNEKTETSTGSSRDSGNTMRQGGKELPGEASHPESNSADVSSSVVESNSELESNSDSDSRGVSSHESDPIAHKKLDNHPQLVGEDSESTPSSPGAGHVSAHQAVILLQQHSDTSESQRLSESSSPRKGAQGLTDFLQTQKENGTPGLRLGLNKDVISGQTDGAILSETVSGAQAIDSAEDTAKLESEASLLPDINPTAVVADAEALAKASNTKPSSSDVVVGSRGREQSPLVGVSVASKMDNQLMPPGTATLDDALTFQQNAEGEDAAMLDAMNQLMATDAAKAKPSAVTALSTQLSTQPSIQSGVIAPGSVVADADLQSGIKAGSHQLSLMASSVGEPGWDGEFLGRVNMLVKGGTQEARIQLSPPEMGRLDIKISTDGDSAKVMFSVDNVAARDAIEQAIPRLRDLLAQGGLQLSHSEVADHSQSQQGRDDFVEPFSSAHTNSAMAEEESEASSWQLGVSVPTSTVDYYI